MGTPICIVVRQTILGLIKTSSRNLSGENLEKFPRGKEASPRRKLERNESKNIQRPFTIGTIVPHIALIAFRDNNYTRY